VGEFGVGGDTDDLGVDRLELVQSGVERENFSWADDWTCQRGSGLCETGSGDSDSGGYRPLRTRVDPTMTHDRERWALV
jgi:hypothetical protein